MEKIAENQEEKNQLHKKIKDEEMQGKLTENMVVSSGYIVDIAVLIESSPELSRLKGLFEFGVTEEMIVNMYFDLSSQLITDEKEAIKTLNVVYYSMVYAINQIPNGIVIDPETGLKDEKASLKEMQAVGIDGAYVPVYEQEKELNEILLGEKKLGILQSIMSMDSVDSDVRDTAMNSYIQLMNNMNFFSIDNNGINQNEDQSQIDNTMFEQLGIDKETLDTMNAQKEYVTIRTAADADLVKRSLNVLFKLEDGKSDFDLKKFERYKNSKYYNELLNENGELDPNKIRDFAKKWKDIENEVLLTNYLKNWLITIKSSKGNFDLDKLNITNRSDFIRTLARGAFSENPENAKMFGEICKSIGIENSVEGVRQIADKYLDEPVETVDDVKRLKDECELTKHNFARKLNGIRDNLMMSKEEKLINNVLKSLAPVTTNKGQKNGNDVKAIVLLYMKYEKDQGKSSSTVRKMIRKYMIENRNIFGEYLKEDEKGKFLTIDRDAMKKLVNEDKANKNIAGGLKRSPDEPWSDIHAEIMKFQIDSRLKRYQKEKESEQHKKKVAEIKRRINESEPISDKEMDALFRTAVDLEIFEDKGTWEKLEQLNVDRFAQNMDDVNNSNPTNGVKKILFSLAHIGKVPIKYMKKLKDSWNENKGSKAEESEGRKENDSSGKSKKTTSNLPAVKKETGLLDRFKGLFKKKEKQENEVDNGIDLNTVDGENGNQVSGSNNLKVEQLTVDEFSDKTTTQNIPDGLAYIKVSTTPTVTENGRKEEQPEGEKDENEVGQEVGE